MTKPTRHMLALDIGAKRIGVAKADTDVRLAFPLETIAVDGRELTRLAELVAEHGVDELVVGYPRNQSGETTKQTAYVESVSETLKALQLPIVFQDESLTSVLAEEQLGKNGKNYRKDAIDAEAATIILQDFLEQTYGY